MSADRTAPGLYSLVTWSGGGTPATRNIGGGIIEHGMRQFIDLTIRPQLDASPSSPVWFSIPAGTRKGENVQVTQLRQMRDDGLGTSADDIIAEIRRLGRPVVLYLGGRWQDDNLLTAAKRSADRERLIRDDLDVWFDLGDVAFDAGSGWHYTDLMYRIARSYHNAGKRVVIEALPSAEKTWLRDFGFCCLEDGYWNHRDRTTWGVVTNRDTTLLCENRNVTAERCEAYRAQGLDVAGVWEPSELTKVLH